MSSLLKLINNRISLSKNKIKYQRQSIYHKLFKITIINIEVNKTVTNFLTWHNLPWYNGLFVIVIVDDLRDILSLTLVLIITLILAYFFHRICVGPKSRGITYFFVTSFSMHHFYIFFLFFGHFWDFWLVKH